jgi:hypothetical protein
MKIFASKENKGHVNDIVIAIGGGATIDEAKIYAKKNRKHCIAIPTTGAGASETTHAVVWSKTKKNIPTDKPSTVIPPFKIKLNKVARRNTCYDILGHLVDYLNVCSDNEIVEVGIMVGRLIEQHPTNLTHPASYPLTLKGMPHGEAVGRVLKESLDKAFPL